VEHAGPEEDEWEEDDSELAPLRSQCVGCRGDGGGDVGISILVVPRWIPSMTAERVRPGTEGNMPERQ
jgi:hypothetical protein